MCVSLQKSSEPSPLKVAKVVGSDHSYASTTDNTHSEVKQLKKTVKIIKQKVQQQKKKNENMEELMKSLKDKQLVSSLQHNLLNHNFGAVSKCLFENQMENSQLKDKHSYCYNLETKQFAMTLHYYSPKAYEFVHNVFFLPPSSIIRSWAESVDCEPGFFCDVIRLTGQATKIKPHMSDVILIVDAVELHKGTWGIKRKDVN